MSKGVLAVVSGFSGAGKGTVMKRLLEKYDTYALSVSVTTRSPRAGEEDGKDYFFHTREEVEEMILEDKLLEYAEYVGNYYGTPREYVENMLESGKNVILEIEIQGAMKIKQKMPDAVMIFVTPPSATELENRLRGRGSEIEETIRRRMMRAVEECEGIERYDYLLVNDDVEECTERLNQIITSERLKVKRNIEFANKIRKELRTLVKGEN